MVVRYGCMWVVESVDLGCSGGGGSSSDAGLTSNAICWDRSRVGGGWVVVVVVARDRDQGDGMSIQRGGKSRWRER